MVIEPWYLALFHRWFPYDSIYVTPIGWGVLALLAALVIGIALFVTRKH